MDSSLDFLSTVIEEIALDGLDGITLSALWVRLENRLDFPLALDKASKSFIWECVAVHKDIEIYELPSSRPPLVLYDRFNHIDEEFGLVTEPEEKIIDIYPVCIIKDGCVLGSCSTYKTRECVTSYVRHGHVLLMSLNQVTEKWPESVVLVASPRVRLLNLVGTEVNPLIEFTKEEYCLLERVGRARYQGEVSQGESGLLATSSALKDHLHYHAMKLINKGLITKQKHILRTKSGKTTSGVLFHLTRYYVQRKAKFDTILECMYDILKNKPNHREVSNNLMLEMGIPQQTFRKLMKRFGQKWFKLSLVPHCEMFPDDSVEKSKTKNGAERQVKVIQMVRPYIEDDSIEDEEEEDCNVNPYYDQRKVDLDLPLELQVYNIIVSAGPSGASLCEVRNAITLPKLDVRYLCRALIKRKKVFKVLIDIGRQRTEKFISKQFENECTSFKNFRKQSQEFHKDYKNFKPEQLEENKSSTLENGTSHLEPNAGKELSVNNKDSNTFQEPEVEVVEEKSVALKNEVKRLPNLTTALDSGFESGVHQVSGRLLKRAILIVSFLKHAKFTTVAELSKIVKAEEEKEGYNYIIDKRSILRLINRLCNDAKVKVLKTVLKLNNAVREIEFICDPSFDSNNEEFKVVVEQAKFRFLSSGKSNTKKHKKNIDDKVCTNNQDKENQLPESVKIPISKMLYGLQPKFGRIKTLHLLLSYLVYHYDGKLVEDGEEPDVYHQTDSWKRFIPPLPPYKLSKGWCLLSDVISRMPLSIFIKTVNLRYEIPKLGAFSNDSRKQHYLIRHLHEDLRNSFLGNRRYLFMISDVLIKMCHMGLVSLGPRIHIEKDQVYVYVHQKSQIKNTTTAPPCYTQIDDSLEYEVIEYNFCEFNDVENYWIDLETTCMHTPLGKHSFAPGQKETLLTPNEKPELVDSSINKEFNQVSDTGVPPGDGLGAAGLDSSLFSHLRRNWIWPSLQNKTCDEQQLNVPPEREFTSLAHLFASRNKKAIYPQSRMRLQRLTKQNILPNNKRTLSSSKEAGPPAKKQKIRKRAKGGIRASRKKSEVKKIRKPYYDEKDKAAMELMVKSRVDWTPQEDSLLLMCKVTSLFLDPTFNKLVVHYPLIRDILNKKFPNLSSNKTSRACQRRLRHMLITSAETRNSVGVFLGEAQQDAELVKEFSVYKPPKTKEDIWKELFCSALDKLLKKFTSTGQEHVTPFPPTADELITHYNIIHPANVMNIHPEEFEPADIADIYQSVLRSIVLSSFSVASDNVNWSYILFRVYEQYADNLLRLTIDKLQKKGLITRKHFFRNDHSLPSTIPYRFTIKYQNTFIMKCPVRIHLQISEAINALNKQEIDSDRDITLSCINVMINYILSKRLLITTEIPEQILIFDTSFDKKDHSTVIKKIMGSLSSDESEELAQLLKEDHFLIRDYQSSDEPKAKRKKLGHTVKKEDGFVNSVKNRDCPSSTVTIITSEVQDCDKEEKRKLSTNSRLVFYMLEDQFLKQAKFHDQISLNPCSLSYELLPKNDNISDNSLDCFESENRNNVIRYHSSYIRMELLSDVDHSETLLNAYKNYASSPEIIKFGKDIFQDICSSGHIGFSHIDIWKKYVELKEPGVFEHLDILLDSQLVLRVGVAKFRYVGIMHSTSWLLHSFMLPSESEINFHKIKTAPSDENSLMEIEENKSNNNNTDLATQSRISETNTESGCEMKSTISQIPNDVPITVDIATKSKMDTETDKSVKRVMFLPRIWRKPDGSLNGPVFIQLLRSILCHVMSAPGINEQHIYERFSLPMQMIEVLELLDVLVKIGCIFRYYLKAAKRPSLFSKCNERSIVTDGGPDDIVHYEAFADASIKLHEFSNLLQYE